MTMVFMEGFDYWTPGTSTTPPKWSLGQTRNGGAGRWGGGSFQNSRTSGSGLVSTGTFPSTSTTMIVGWAQNTLSGSSYVQLMTAANVVVASMRNNGGNPAVYNAAGTLVVTGTSGAVSGWHYYELKIFANGASGTCELHCDGILDIASTTGNFGSTAIGALGLFISSVASIRVDDIYALDTSGSTNNDFLGDYRIQLMQPTGAGSHTEFTPSAGANWQNVDDVLDPDDDTTYNRDSTTPGDRDTFVTAGIDASALPAAVQLNLYARKDATAARQLAGVVRQGGVDFDGTTQTLGSGYAYTSQLYDTDPTAAVWTAANVNADEFGYKLVA